MPAPSRVFVRLYNFGIDFTERRANRHRLKAVLAKLVVFSFVARALALGGYRICYRPQVPVPLCFRQQRRFRKQAPLAHHVRPGALQWP